MIRWMCDNIRRDKVRNKDIRKKILEKHLNGFVTNTWDKSLSCYHQNPTKSWRGAVPIHIN